MVNTKEIIIGLVVGLLIAGLIYGLTYLPGYFKRDNFPPKHSIKFVSINDYSFRDWALRLNEDNLELPHTGYFRSHLMSFPILLKDVGIPVQTENDKTIIGQFESIGQKSELFGKFEATISKLKPTEIKVELFSGKFSDANVSSNRISGKINITENIESNAIKGTLQIGSTNYGGIPFSGTNLNFDGDINQINANVITQVSGHQGTSVELSGAFVQQNFLNISGLLNISSLRDLTKTVQIIAMGEEIELPDFIDKISSLEIEIQQDMSARIADNAIKFDVMSPVFGEGYKGAAILDKTEQILELGARFNNYWIESYPYNFEKISGNTRTQAVSKLFLNGINDDVFGPVTSRLENVTLQKGDLVLKDLNALIRYESLTPLKIEDSSLKISEMVLDDAIQNVSISIEQESNLFVPKTISGLWNNTEVSFDLAFSEDRELPDLNITNIYDDVAELSDLLRLNLQFSAPLEFSKTWKFNGTSYVSDDLDFKNAEPGILTLNEDIPELTNIYVKNMRLKLEDEKTALLTVKGKHPLIYGQRPIKISTKLERIVE